MKRNNRIALFIFILGFILFLGLAFSSWIVPNIITPAALAVWLFLRIFILSIDQKYFWWLLTFSAAIWGIYRLTRGEEPVVPETHTIDHEALDQMKSWRSVLTFSRSDSIECSIVKRKLILLLTSHYATRQYGSTEMEIRQALEQRLLPLPDPLYDFLFQPEPEKSSAHPWRAFIQACRRWYRRASGQETAEFNQMVDEFIHFVGNSLEN